MQRGKDALGIGAVSMGGGAIGARIAGKQMGARALGGVGAAAAAAAAMRGGYKEFEELGGWRALRNEARDFVNQRFRRCSVPAGTPNFKYSDLPDF